MAQILIAYATKNGQTLKIADFIGNELMKMGHRVDFYNCEQKYDADPGQYHAVIVGGPVRFSSLPKPLEKWVRNHCAHLQARPTVFFSVCLGILQKENERVQNEERQIVENFFAKTHWHPVDWTIFAGALKYSQYNWFLKRLMHWISKKAGRTTDMSIDYEYTHWADVQAFVQKVDSFVQRHSEQPRA